jgi:UDP-N-acetylglucosamine 2-epimerase (non-hydrolysing)
VHVTGNTVVDALLDVSPRIRSASDPALAHALASGRRLVLLTAHRRESFGVPIRRVFQAVRTLADERDDVTVVYPVHPNPNVREPAQEILSGHPRVALTEPMSYLDLVLALREATLVLTDSGGIQEEAPTFGTPVLVLREVTERPEGIEAGVAELVGTDPELLLARARALLARGKERGGVQGAGGRGAVDSTLGGTAGSAGVGYLMGGTAHSAGVGHVVGGSAGLGHVAGGKASPYGDGRAAERIVDIVLASLLGRPRRTTDWAGP